MRVLFENTCLRFTRFTSHTRFTSSSSARLRLLIQPPCAVFSPPALLYPGSSIFPALASMAFLCVTTICASIVLQCGHLQWSLVVPSILQRSSALNCVMYLRNVDSSIAQSPGANVHPVLVTLTRLCALAAAVVLHSGILAETPSSPATASPSTSYCSFSEPL